MKQHLRSVLSAAAVIALFGWSLASAQAETKPDHPHPPKPPKEAYTACANLIENDACSISTPDGNVLDGVCAPAPDSKESKESSTLACRPNHMPKPPKGEPPQGAPEDEEAAE